MRVPMMDIWVVRMGVRQHRMMVGMDMRLRAVPGKGMIVLVMLVMAVAVAVLERIMRVGDARVALAGAAKDPCPSAPLPPRKADWAVPATARAK